MHGSARRTLPGGHRPSPPPLKRKEPPRSHIPSAHLSICLLPSFLYCGLFTRHPAPAPIFPCARLCTETFAGLAWRRKEREFPLFRRRAHALWLTCQRSYTYSRAGTIPGLLSHARQQPDIYLAPRDHIRQPATGNTYTTDTSALDYLYLGGATQGALRTPHCSSRLPRYCWTSPGLRWPCSSADSAWLIYLGALIPLFGFSSQVIPSYLIPGPSGAFTFFLLYLHASVSFPGRFRPVGLDITDSLAPASLHT